MFRPNYLTCLKSYHFNESNSCLEQQLVDVINYFDKIFNNIIWYASDVTTLTITPEIEQYRQFVLKKIGSTIQLIQAIKNTEQFYSGVFIAIKEQSYVLPHIELGTEDKQFRPISSNSILIEIRAFDTSFFEIFSESKNLIQKISQHYNSEVLQPSDL